MLAIRTRREWIAGNWFWLVLPVLLAISFGLPRWESWTAQDTASEAVLLFDWCVTVPALYALCYRRTMGLGRLLLRLFALACLGVWLVAWMVPADAQTVVPHFSALRWVGLAVLALIELRMVAAAVQIAFSGKGTAAEIERASGAPPLIAKLMLLEARFWRVVWTFIRRR
jgi:peptidoglycan/LPS O-acetylase OafA/YrhL